MLNGEYYALKEIPKLMLRHSIDILSFLQEPKILKKFINYNFIQNIISSFDDHDNLYLVTNYYEGSNLDYYKDEIMNEEQIKFISACIIQSFIYLRNNSIIHRDISMRNLIFDKERYLNLIDLSYAINYKDKNDFNNYLICLDPYDNSPEIQIKSKYDYNLDYYKLGANIIYYLIFKKNANAVKKEKNISELVIDSKSIKNYSSNCIDFINKLIKTDFKKRIGFKSINELKNHLWFDGFDWKNLEQKKLISPLIFNKEQKFFNNKCSKFYFSEEKIMKHKKSIRNNYYKKLIKEYNYVNKNIIIKILDLVKKQKNL